MAPAEKDQDKTEDKQNVFLRLRNLPSVSITFEVIGRSYSSAKAANPLLSSVCGVCEEGVRSAGILAARSMQPAVHLLQPQLVAANSLACRGLDRLEEKMPALDYPPAKLAAGISDLMSSAVRSPAVQYVLSSKISQLAEEGADSALTLTERLVNYILPASSEEKEEKLSEVCVTAPKPSFVRLGVLAGTVWSRAYGKTSALLQQIKRQGQKLTSPGVTPQCPGNSSNQRDDVLHNGGEGRTAEESNGSDQKNSPSRSSQESVKDGEHVEPQSSEELRILHTKQILERSRPEPPVES